MGLNLQSHEWKRDQKTGQTVIDRENPYIRLAMKDQAPIYLQNGEAYYEDGVAVPILPEWARDQIAKCNPVLMKRIGWTPDMATAKPSSASNSILPTPASLPTPIDLSLDPAPLTIAQANTPPELPQPVDPRSLKWFALKAWARREHGVDGDNREVVLEQLAAKGVLEG